MWATGPGVPWFCECVFTVARRAGDVGVLLRRVVCDGGMSLHRLSDEAKISGSAVRQVTGGRVSPQLSALRGLTVNLGYEVASLFRSRFGWISRC